MTDLEDIAAEAHIAIVECAATDGGDSLTQSQDIPSPSGLHARSSLQSTEDAAHSENFPSVEELNVLFSHRYSDEDPDYVKIVEMANDWLKPPCVENFFVRRQRDDSRGNRRGGGDGRGSYHHRGDGDREWRGRRGGFHDERNRNHRNHSGWGGGDYRGRDHSSDRGYHYDRESSNSHSSRGRDRSPYR